MDFYDEYVRPERGARQKNKAKAGRLYGAVTRERAFGDFTCRHCGREVSAAPERSGVRNRNHCPYCLWSKHVDLNEAGDRLAACKAPMQPVALTFKLPRKKYASAQPGELMLVHQCTGCGGLSINRVAADDGLALLWDVFEAALALPPAVRAAAQADGIEFAGSEAREVVSARVWGRR